MGDEPPDYIDWGDKRSGGAFAGCFAMAGGLLFILTGGLCVTTGLSGAGFGQLMVGVLMILIGLAVWKSGK